MMAFCDNPKCRWHNCNGCEVVYVELEPFDQVPFDQNRAFNPLAQMAKFTQKCVKSHLFGYKYYDKEVNHRFCDECEPLAKNAILELKTIDIEDRNCFATLIQKHGDNLFLHFVQSEWFAKENANKKSQF